MKKATIPILISLIFSGGVFAQDIPENQEYPKDVEELLNEAISLNDFERGLAYVTRPIAVWLRYVIREEKMSYTSENFRPLGKFTKTIISKSRMQKD